MKCMCASFTRCICYYIYINANAKVQLIFCRIAVLPRCMLGNVRRWLQHAAIFCRRVPPNTNAEVCKNVQKSEQVQATTAEKFA